jgi:hypothetical protein
MTARKNIPEDEYAPAKAIERCYSLRAAARELRILPGTLKGLLYSELGLRLPESLPRGSKFLIRRSIIDQLIAVKERRRQGYAAMLQSFDGNERARMARAIAAK